MPTAAHALRERLARGALALTRRAGRRLGQHVTVANMYSVIPEIPPESDPIWSRRSGLLEVDSEAAMDFVETTLSRFIPEMPDVEVWNGLYEGGDAELLYAMVRHAKPKRVLELGSGFSTRTDQSREILMGRSKYSGKSVSEAAYEMLREANRSMHAKELVQRLVEGGLQIKGKTPLTSVATSLKRDKRFKKVGPNTFEALEESLIHAV